MSVSTNATLFFGYCWDEEVRLFTADKPEGEWMDIVLHRRGVHNPYNDFPAGSFDHIRGYAEKCKAENEWFSANRKSLDDYLRQVRQVVEEFGIVVGDHCSDSCRMPYVAVAGAVKSAYRGDPQAIDPAKLVADPAWPGKLDRFLNEFGITKPQPEPGWWLVSIWG